jgi:hypothetical protein
MLSGLLMQGNLAFQCQLVCQISVLLVVALAAVASVLLFTMLAVARALFTMSWFCFSMAEIVLRNDGKWPIHVVPNCWKVFNEKYQIKRGLFFLDGQEWQDVSLESKTFLTLLKYEK